MPRDSKVYLDDMKEAITKIQTYTREMTFESFTEKEIVVDAVIRNLAIIGEAVKNLSSDIKKGAKEIEWKKIAGLRDILVHAYFGINKRIVWDIVEKKIPELKKFLEGLETNDSKKKKKV